MAAITNNKDRARKEPRTMAYPIAASTKIPQGAIACENSSKYAVNGADTAGLRMLGVSRHMYDNSSGAAGAMDVVVDATGVFEFDTAITSFRVGDTAYIADNNTVTDAATATNDVAVGVIRKVETGKVWVDIGR